MRILQVFEPTSGGVPVHVEILTAELVKRGHSLDVVVPSGAGLEPRFARHGARVFAADLVPEIFAHGRNARALGQLARRLRSGSYDVVHLHGAKAGTLGRLAALVSRTPALYSSHAFVYRSQLKRDRRGRRARHALTLGIERALAPATRTIVCVSNDEREAALRDRIAGDERLGVAYYGTPLNGAAEPDPELLQVRGDGPLFGFMARLQEQKGLPLLLGALCRLRDRGTLPRFAIVGDGPLRGWVEERIAAEGLGERVLLKVFEPPVEPKLAAFDVYVLSSLWEALPIGVLEAMAAGLPVISTAVNGVPEAVDHETTGLLVPPNDAAALAGAIERMAADPALRERMGRAGRRRCEELFTVSRMTERIEELYRESIER